jgi:hypothetical protein
MGLNASVQQFVESLNDRNRYLLLSSEESPKQLDQDESIEISDQGKAPEWHEIRVDENIDIFEMPYEESISYFQYLEIWRKFNAQMFHLQHYQQIIKSPLPVV